MASIKLAKHLLIASVIGTISFAVLTIFSVGTVWLVLNFHAAILCWLSLWILTGYVSSDRVYGSAPHCYVGPQVLAGAIGLWVWSTIVFEMDLSGTVHGQVVRLLILILMVIGIALSGWTSGVLMKSVSVNRSE
jgi:hypothetical protein